VAYAVLTRDRDDVAAYADALAPLEVVVMPVTRAMPPADRDALARALETGGFAAIVVASRRAAHALEVAAIANNLHPGTRRELPEIFAVGPATLHALAALGTPAHHPAGVRDGADLARALVAFRDLRGKRVLVPRAEDGRTEAIEILRAAGAEVVDVIAYRTEPTPPGDSACAPGAALLARGEAAVTCLFAPSQVAALAAHAGPLGAVATRFCAIGETTAAALRQGGVSSVSVAPTPTPEGIAQAVRAVYPPGR
jgi:uroporphyrinogen-III synthase